MVIPSQRPVNSGTLDLLAFLSLPPLPPIITEWSALVPLICHLASYEEDHRMVGELMLTGRLSTGLFPKLGYLNGIWRFLDRGPDFLDRANTRSECKFKVWDASWGGTFTRANGTASSVITEYALFKHREVYTAPEPIRQSPASESAGPSPSPPSQSLSGPTPTSSFPSHRNSLASSPFRRHQTLHVVRLHRKVQLSSSRTRALRASLHNAGQILYVLSLLGMITLLVFLGAYGTSIVLLSSVLSKVVCFFINMSRPPGYLESSERQEACMLSAAQDNASTWYLYIGDRGVVDWLLNKTMLTLPSAKTTLMNIFAAYFHSAHLLQILAMTYVAAQKGIDGVSLLVLMLGNYGVRLLGGKYQIARQWLDREGVGVEARTFRFSGRTPVVGCVYSLSGAGNPKWMDALISPSRRREIWLQELSATGEGGWEDKKHECLNSSDSTWVRLHTRMARDAIDLVRQHFSRESRL